MVMQADYPLTKLLDELHIQATLRNVCGQCVGGDLKMLHADWKCHYYFIENRLYDQNTK